MKAFAVLVLIYHLGMIMEPVNGDPDMDKLVSTLLQNYVQLAPPAVRNMSVDVLLSVSDVEYDPITGLLAITSWEKYFWTDKRLSWNPDEFGGIGTVRLPASVIWTPDIVPYNTYRNNHDRKPVSALVYSDGSIWWIPPNVFQVRCEKAAPSHGTPSQRGDDGILTCKLKLGSWTYDGFGMELTSAEDEPKIDLSSFVANENTELVSTEVEIKSIVYECCEEPYMSYDATFKVKPRA